MIALSKRKQLDKVVSEMSWRLRDEHDVGKLLGGTESWQTREGTAEQSGPWRPGSECKKGMGNASQGRELCQDVLKHQEVRDIELCSIVADAWAGIQSRDVSLILARRWDPNKSVSRSMRWWHIHMCTPRHPSPHTQTLQTLPMCHSHIISRDYWTCKWQKPFMALSVSDDIMLDWMLGWANFASFCYGISQSEDSDLW